MLKGLSRNRSSLFDILGLLVFGIGVYLRWKYILVDHPPRNFLDSDVNAYVEASKSWFGPGYVLKPSDIFLPPAAAYLFSGLFHIDPTMMLGARFMFVVASLIPVVFALLAWAIFGKQIARGTLILASLYPPLITYGGFFFLEIPLALLLGLTMALYAWAARMKSLPIALAMATVSGICLSLAMGFRMGALPAMALFVATFTRFFDGSSHPSLVGVKDAPSDSPASSPWPAFAGTARRAKLLMLACVLAGALPLTLTMSARCTIGNGNNFCLVSNRSSAEVLLGHNGRIVSMIWAAPKLASVELSYTAGTGHGYSEVRRWNFGATSELRNWRTTWDWVSHHIQETFLLTVEHIYDTFGGAFSWPKVANNSWMLVQTSQYYFSLFILLPVCFLMLSLGIKLGFRGLLKSGEFLVASPILGLLGAVIITTGEERFRIPFDGVLIICAVVFYRDLLTKPSEEQSALRPAPVAVVGRLRKLLARITPRHTDIACLFIFLGGVALRWHFITRFHDPRKFVFSDPATYVAIAERWIKAPGKTNWVDAMVPPGIGYFLKALFKLDPTKLVAVWAMFILTSLIPVVIFLIAWGMFNRSVAKGALVVACFYVPFIAYGGFFMTEIPITFCLLLSLCAFVGAMRVKRRWKTLGLALLAGFLASVGASFKLAALPTVILFAVVSLLFYDGSMGGLPDAEPSAGPTPKRSWFNISGPKRTLKLIMVAGVFAGALPLMVAMSLRCTRINDGKYCLVCTNAQQNFLLGHYGRISSITWKSRQGTFAFGSASAAQHAYGATKQVPFGISDAEKNTAEGWKWMRENPKEAVVLSLEHVFDTFGGSVAWPPNVTYAWLSSELSQHGLIAFIFVPALWLCLEIARKRGIKGLLASREFLVLSPNLGIVATVLAATGEARYRIPLDGLIIIVGVQFYHSYIVAPWMQAAKTNARPASET